jgi:hypothetical protein
MRGDRSRSVARKNGLNMDEAEMLTLTDTVRVRHSQDFVALYPSLASRGPDYYEVRANETDPNQLMFGDLAWAVLLEGQPRSVAAQTLLGIVPYDISGIPSTPLEELHFTDLQAIADVITDIRHQTKGIRSAIATKMLHPKRRATLPVLDNQAIFRSFLASGWRPGDPLGSASRATVIGALEAIHHCLTRPDNLSAWKSLQEGRRDYTRVELFDMIWWTVLRAPSTQLVKIDGAYELRLDEHPLPGI